MTITRGLIAVALGLFSIGCSSDDGAGPGGSGGTGGSGASGGSGGGGGSSTGGSGGGIGSGFGLGSDKPAGGIAAMVLRDVETSETFDAVGRPTGDGAESLVPVAGFNQFWFAWSVWNDGSEIFEHAAPNTTAPLQAEAECAVPCDEIVLGCPGTDCIPALTTEELQTSKSTGTAIQVDPADPGASYLSDNSFVVGVAIGGDARAYPHNVFWWHEIVNDVVGGTPLSITHCPLTFSSVGHDPAAFVTGQTAELGVSGRLYNSNLVFYNRTDDTWFNQLLGVGTKGAQLNEAAPRVHVWEMTWAAWRALHPDTTVLSQETGHARNYERYPYSSYFVDHADTFRPTNPSPDPAVPNKAITYGVRVGGGAKAYVHDDLAAWAASRGQSAPVGVVNDTVGSAKIAVVFDIDAGYVQAFERTGRGDLELVP